MFDFYRSVYCGHLIANDKDFERALVFAKAYLNLACVNGVPEIETIEAKTGLCALCDTAFSLSDRYGTLKEKMDFFEKSYADSDVVCEMNKTAALFFPPEILSRAVR